MVMFDIYDTSAEAYLKGTGIGDTAYFGSSVLVNPSKTGRVLDLG
jgi:hypothetical protein